VVNVTPPEDGNR